MKIKINWTCLTSSKRALAHQPRSGPFHRFVTPPAAGRRLAGCRPVPLFWKGIDRYSTAAMQMRWTRSERRRGYASAAAGTRRLFVRVGSRPQRDGGAGAGPLGLCGLFPVEATVRDCLSLLGLSARPAVPYIRLSLSLVTRR